MVLLFKEEDGIREIGLFVVFGQKTACEVSACLVGSEVCRRDRCVHGQRAASGFGLSVVCVVCVRAAGGVFAVCVCVCVLSLIHI